MHSPTQYSCRILTDGKSKLPVFVAGDALLEPFWPEGLGVNRGFHTALDTVRVPSGVE